MVTYGCKTTHLGNEWKILSLGAVGAPGRSRPGGRFPPLAAVIPRKYFRVGFAVGRIWLATDRDRSRRPRLNLPSRRFESKLWRSFANYPGAIKANAPFIHMTRGGNLVEYRGRPFRATLRTMHDHCDRARILDRWLRQRSGYRNGHRRGASRKREICSIAIKNQRG